MSITNKIWFYYIDNKGQILKTTKVKTFIKYGPPWKQWHLEKVSSTHIRVSTVFLGMDYSFGKGAPILFETIVFAANGDDIETCRYVTKKDAEEGHAKLVKKYT